MLHFLISSIMELEFEIFKCSPAVTFTCTADVPTYVTFTSQKQVNLQALEFGFSKNRFLHFCCLVEDYNFSVKTFLY